MEIKANNSTLIIDDDAKIDNALDVIVCALNLEGWSLIQIHDALIGKAEEMETIFNVIEKRKE